MANVKISELPSATTPLGGTEEVEIVQAGVNKKVSVSEFGGGSQNIDQVLAVGDSATDKQINFFNGTNEVFISGDGLSFQDNVASENLGMDAHKISKLNGSNVVELEFVAPTGTAGKIRFPDVVNATKIVAMTDQIPTIDATPTDGSNNAVSSNGVFDALATKQNSLGFTPYKFLQTSQTAHTGTTAETIIATATITGNIFNSNDVMKMLYRFTKPSGTAGGAFQIRINTSNTLSGSVVIFAGSFNNTTRQGLVERTFDLQGGNLYGFSFASSVSTDVVSGTTALSSTTYNTANILYVFFTVQLSNSADSVTPNLCNITN